MGSNELNFYSEPVDYKRNMYVKEAGDPIVILFGHLGVRPQFLLIENALMIFFFSVQVVLMELRPGV